jgi:hypothetical protein
VNGRRSNSGQELLDLAEDRVLVAEIGAIHVTGQLDGVRIGNVRTEVTAARSMGDVSPPVDYERRDSTGRQQVSHIDTQDRRKDGGCGSGIRGPGVIGA